MIGRAPQDGTAGPAEPAGSFPAVAVSKVPLALVVEIAGKMVAVVTTLTAHTTRIPTRKRLTGKGSVRLASETLAHLRATVLPHANQVAESLGVPPLGLELSVTNSN
jgi:prepilin signal peptidase PulO-like enzyme (type II secretory pathway)